MSEGKKLGRPFTPATAPRQGGKPGRKAKLSAEALLILERLMKDWKKYGYAKLALETAAKLGMAETVESVINDVPTVLIVKWADPAHPPAPPPEVFKPTLTLLPRPPDDELN